MVAVVSEFVHMTEMHLAVRPALPQRLHIVTVFQERMLA
jgi:hypothetical protein